MSTTFSSLQGSVSGCHIGPEERTVTVRSRRTVPVLHNVMLVKVVLCYWCAYNADLSISLSVIAWFGNGSVSQIVPKIFQLLFANRGSQLMKDIDESSDTIKTRDNSNVH